MSDSLDVLIVDDSLLAEHALKSYFTRLGHNVVGLARDGDQGKELYESHKPDLVTVDAIMPGMSGQDYIRYLNQKDKENGTQTKIMMISSDLISDQERAELRVDCYLIKPVTLQKLEDALRSI
ncbi:MAG: response regulator [Candidatus Kariarchaeaceae archaeon]|jgi:two-component system chemotaxis response regulator CheY